MNEDSTGNVRGPDKEARCHHCGGSVSPGRERLAGLALEAINARIDRRRKKIAALEMDLKDEHAEVALDEAERDAILAELGIDAGPDPLFQFERSLGIRVPDGTQS